MKIAIEIPRKVWTADFSRRHPELLLKVHNTMEVNSQKSLADFEVNGTTEDLTLEIAEFPDVLSAERIDIPPNLTLYRVLYRRPDYLRHVSERGILLNFPRTVQNGVFLCETTARSSQVRELIAAFQRARDTAKLISLQKASHPHRDRVTDRPALTETQEGLFRQALELGYFEVPRRITLTRLAAHVGRSKSAVSHALALVERYLVQTSAMSTQ